MAVLRTGRAAERLGVTAGRLRQLTREGRVPHFVTDWGYGYAEDTIDELRAQRVRSDQSRQESK